MPSSALLYKCIRQVKDKQFDVDKISQYSLLIHLGACDCQVAVLDASNRRLVFFEDYIFNGRCSPANQLSLIKKLADSHPFLNAGFWKRVNFVVKNSKFAQVPASLFAEEAADKYLGLNAKLNADKVLHFGHKNGGFITVFAIFDDVFKWAKDKYKNTAVHFYHQAAGMMEGVYMASKQSRDTPLHLYIDRFKLHITLMHNGKLVYYNQFSIEKFIEYVKYTMMVLKTMRMNPQTSRVVLSGYIKEKSPHFAQFSKYIGNVSLAKRPGHLKFGHAFDEIEDHNFFDLYSGYLLTY